MGKIGEFLNNKPWHPSSRQNQTLLFEAEERQREEQQRLEERQEELKQERAREELAELLRAGREKLAEWAEQQGLACAPRPPPSIDGHPTTHTRARAI